MFFGYGIIAASTAATDAAGGGLVSLISLLPILLMVVVMYFLLLRPQKKKEKEQTQMRKNLQIGDEVTTVGGVIGIVVQLTEDAVLLETGSNRSKLRVKRWAIQSCETVHDAPED